MGGSRDRLFMSAVLQYHALVHALTSRESEEACLSRLIGVDTMSLSIDTQTNITEDASYDRAVQIQLNAALNPNRYSLLWCLLW